MTHQPGTALLIGKTPHRPPFTASWDPPPGASRALRDPPARSEASTGGRTARTQVGGAAPFHELAYEGYVLADAGTGKITYSDHRLMELIGAVDVVHVSGYSAQATGTTPRLFVSLEYSNERSYFFPLNPILPAINGLNLSTGGETLFQGTSSLPHLPHLAYGRVAIWVTGTDARAFLRIWVTGRDRSRRSAASAQPQAMPRHLAGLASGIKGRLGQKV